MNSEFAIEVKNVKKKFKVYIDKGNSMKEKILFRNRNQYQNKLVLKDISFQVKKGEAIGLIGQNGCGKSTLLKMLTKIMYPTEGTIQMNGRVSSLIELGAGFHPDMSGRENIFTNASIFGLNHSEIEKRMKDIISFSELEDFIDNPVRTYSSGMYMRLAFAVAINVDADILLIDEILAVGDVNFQEKCFEKLEEIKRKGTTIVIVSHAMGQINKICDRCIWIEEGLIKEIGKTKIVGEHYLESMQDKRLIKIENDFKSSIKENKIKRIGLPIFATKEAIRKGNQKIHFTNARIMNEKLEEKIIFTTQESFEIELSYASDIVGEKINFSLNITRNDGVHCFGTSALSGAAPGSDILSAESGKVVIKIKNNNLLSGKYLIDIAIQGIDGSIYDYIYNALEFRINNKKCNEVGIVHLDREWNIDNIRKICPK